MAAQTSVMDPEVREVLEFATVEDGVVKLPRELERDLYERTDKVLKALGGKWDRHKAGHVFPRTSDAKTVLSGAIAAGAYIDPRLNGYFPTPPDLVRRVIGLAAIPSGAAVLEPSAGRGALADAAARENGDPSMVYVCELLVENAAVLREKGFRFLVNDFMELSDAFRFPYIVMNPPFQRGQDCDHVLRAWTMLKPGGTLVAIMTAAVESNGTKKHAAVRELIDRYGHLERNPPDSFAVVGTKVNTATVVLMKPERW